MNYQERLKIYYDAEFTGLTQDTSLISIGLKSESGSYFYAEFTDYDEKNLSSWIIENVIGNLIIKEGKEVIKIMNVDGSEVDIVNRSEASPYSLMIKGTKQFIAERLIDWMKNESDIAGKKIQIYCDCYAYDWVLFNTVISKEGNALNIPDFIDYIPIDLSTALKFYNVDPDINREQYIGTKAVENISNDIPFSNWKSQTSVIKHNSLWDAYVCQECFNKIEGEYSNQPSGLRSIMDEEIPE